MTRWKRTGLSLVSAIIAEFLIGFVCAIANGKHLFFEHIFGFVYFASLLVIPGWLIALPVIVIPKKASSLPKWQLGLIGTLIGPAVMIAIGIYAAIADHTFTNYNREAWYLVGIAVLVSGATTALYITALKLFSRPTQTPSS